MLIDVLRNGDVTDILINLLAKVFVVFCTLPVHEFAHAFTATKLGDDTARLKGRLTLNPLAHLDIIGSIMIMLVGFGYAKPVPVNARNFKNPKAGMAITAAAGPLSNLIMALLFCMIHIPFWGYYQRSGAIFASVAGQFFYWAASVNVTLGIFNLIPVPPLDGSRILNIFLPSKYYFKLMQYERYIMIGVMVLLFTDILTAPLSFISGAVMSGIEIIARLPFKAFGLIQ